jgi:MFS family permease
MSTASTATDQAVPTTAPAQIAHSMTRALRHANYRLFFGGQLISLVGTFLTQTATLWFVYRLTNSYRLMGTIAFLGQLPVFLLTPVAGVFADRVNRRRFIVWTQVLSMLQSFGLAALAFFFGRGLHPNLHIVLPGLVGLAIFQGLINSFDLPARQAFLVEMVTDRADLPNAIALNSTMVHGSRVLGPIAAGLIIGLFNESVCFFADGLSYLAVIAALLAMKVIPLPPKPRRSVRVELMEGLKYAWQFTPIRTLLIFMATLSLTGMPAAQILLPGFGDYFGGKHGHGSLTFGLLSTTSGVGALIGAFYLASRRSVLGLGRLIGIAVGVFGVAIICFSQSRHLWLSLLIIPFLGWGTITAFASSNTIIQTLVDDDKRGRVMSFFGMAFLGMAPFGSKLAGQAAEWLTPANGDKLVGASRTLMIAGGITITATLVYFTQLPAVRKAARPFYIQKGILPEVAAGLQVADEVAGGE